MPDKLKKLLSPRGYLVELVALVAYVVGAYWRFHYILTAHDPRKFVYSDMKMYFDLGIRLAQPGYVPRPNDVTHPPGVSEVIAFFARRDGARLGILEKKSFFAEMSKLALDQKALGDLVHVQLGLSLLVPLCVAFLGWIAFGRRTALVASAIASLYYPFVEYGGYFLAEIYMMFLVPLVLGGYLLAIRLADRGGAKGWGLGLVVAALAGFCFFLTLSMKMVALPGIVGFLGLHFLLTRGPSRKIRAAVIAVLLVAATPGTIGISNRCTAANDGTFCFGSNKSGADFLLGHYGRIQGISWKPKQGPHYSFGSPSAYQHGYREVPEVPFGIFDSKANEEAAWAWIKKNPTQAAVLSVEHVADSFVGALPWPAYATNFWQGAQAALYGFILFLLFPTGVLLVDLLRQRGVVGLLRSTELSILSPIFGVSVAVAIATGEIRYRIPWDGVFIILAVEWYRRLKVPFWEVADATATSGAGAAPAPRTKGEDPPRTKDEDPPRTKDEDPPRTKDEDPPTEDEDEADRSPAPAAATSARAEEEPPAGAAEDGRAPTDRASTPGDGGEPTEPPSGEPNR